jgi:hypothetical protein
MRRAMQRGVRPSTRKQRTLGNVVAHRFLSALWSRCHWFPLDGRRAVFHRQVAKLPLRTPAAVDTRLVADGN